MNEQAIRWAWGQNLPSTHKLVLLALADLADAAGQCSPNISSLAVLCNVSTRTIRRALRDLEADSLLTAQTRLRPDGSVTSNQYALAMTGGFTMSPALDTHVIGPGHLLAGANDTSRHGGADYAGMATHHSASGAGAPSEYAGAPALWNADREITLKQSTDFLGDTPMPGIVLDNNAPPPSPTGTTPYTSHTDADTASTLTTEKPFAYLRSVIGR